MGDVGRDNCDEEDADDGDENEKDFKEDCRGDTAECRNGEVVTDRGMDKEIELC
jgi:hypothetical protein